MNTLTAKKSFVIQGVGEKHIVPVGAKIMFLKETYYFYHAYYESHTHKALVNFNNLSIELRFHRVHGTNSFKVLNCNPTHGNKNQTFWKNLFEEDCLLEIK